MGVFCVLCLFDIAICCFMLRCHCVRWPLLPKSKCFFAWLHQCFGSQVPAIGAVFLRTGFWFKSEWAFLSDICTVQMAATCFGVGIADTRRMVAFGHIFARQFEKH